MLFFATIATLVFFAQAYVRPPVPNLDGRIVGGTPTTIANYPYQVALLLDYWGNGVYSQSCGGSIITRSYIVTAGHCTDGTRASQWRIRAGSTYHNTGGQVISVLRYVQHSGFNSRLDNDISLLYLVTQLPLGVGIATITLPRQGQVVADNATSVVTGWGTLTQGGSSSSQLYKVNVPVVNQQRCVSAYAAFNQVTSNMICAGRMGVGGVDACQGDSGGPLAINGTLIGITSWGRGCAQANYPGVYTRVPSFRNWIDANTRA